MDMVYSDGGIMKEIIYNCDVCSRKIDPALNTLASLDGDLGRSHYNHCYHLDLCKDCYIKLLKVVREKLSENKKKQVRQVF